MTTITSKEYLSEDTELEVKIDTQIFHKFLDVGILKEDDRVELVEGRMYEMTPIGLRHMAVVKRLGMFFSKQAGDKFIVGIQDGIRLSEYIEVYPDITILKFKDDFYVKGYPDPENDILLIIEVADKSLKYDRNKKLPLYAGAKVLEVWIVNLQEGVVEVYQYPDSKKKEYTLIRRVSGGEIKPLKLEDITLLLTQITQILKPDNV